MTAATQRLLSSTRPRHGAESPRLRRVLYAVVLDPAIKLGSLEEEILLLARAFRERGSVFLPLFLCPQGPGKTALFDDAGLPAACLGRDYSTAAFRQLVELIDRHQIEVIDWNFTSPLGNRFLWWLTVLRPRLRHFLTDHTSRPMPLPPALGRLRRVVKWVVLGRYAKVFCVSRFVRDCHAGQRMWPSLVCRPHFVNTERFRPDTAVRAAVRGELNADGQFVVITVAQLIAAKGIDVAIRAVSEVSPDVVLWVVGDGVEANALRGLSAQLGVADRVKFLGARRDVAPFLQAGDCFACPSRWAEAAGLVNLEAQACGLPVVASRVGGIPEYVADGQTGFLVPADDHRRLAECLRRLHGSPELCHRVGLAARARAVEQFSAAVRMPEYLNGYRDPIDP